MLCMGIPVFEAPLLCGVVVIQILTKQSFQDLRSYAEHRNEYADRQQIATLGNGTDGSYETAEADTITVFIERDLSQKSDFTVKESGANIS
ncbi:MAG: hypothetical protein JWM11_344 [Planctomycetaceae bacterium]|nr:hypothetical protein [Planctomycetaceae bacterium]